MLNSKTRLTIVACSLVAVLFALPSEGKGGLFDRLYPWSWRSPAPAGTAYAAPYTYAPPYTAQRVAYMPVLTGVSVPSNPVPQTCYYTPQTSYRWSYSRMPVTSYRPVTVMDSCTGCPRTAYRPVTTKTLLPWLHRKPHTSYRLTCSSTCAPACPTGCYTGCYSAWPTSCGVGYGACSAVSGSACSVGCTPITTMAGAGSSGYDPGYAPMPTFETGEADDEDTSQPDPQMNPAPDPNSDPASMRKLRVINPENRTAARPVQYATYHRPVGVIHTPDTRSKAPLDVSGWQASRD